jgi:hypothetical protein
MQRSDRVGRSSAFNVHGELAGRALPQASPPSSCASLETVNQKTAMRITSAQRCCSVRNCPHPI